MKATNDRSGCPAPHLRMSASLIWGATVCLLALALAAVTRAEGPGTLRKGDPSEVGFDPGRLQRALRFVEDSVEAGNASAAIVLVARRGVVVAERAFGVFDPTSKRPYTTETIYSIASISKPIAATAAMILVDEGRLGLNDPVKRYLPAFTEQKLKTPAGDLVHRPFTIRHLLTHTAGLPSNSPLRELPTREWLSFPLSKTVDATASVELEYEPGTRTQYSPVGFAILGRVVEVVSGQPFEQFVTERVFDPLGMRHSFYNVPRPLADRVAPGFFVIYKDGKFVGTDPHDPDFKIVNTMPNAGVFSTTHDLAVFYQMFLNGGTYSGRRVLSPATVRLMLADQTVGLTSRWGLSWMLGAGKRDAGVPVYSPETFSHIGAGVALAWADPREDLIGIILTGGPLGRAGDVLTRFQHMVHAAISGPAGPAPGTSKLTTDRRATEVPTVSRRIANQAQIDASRIAKGVAKIYQADRMKLASEAMPDESSRGIEGEYRVVMAAIQLLPLGRVADAGIRPAGPVPGAAAQEEMRGISEEVRNPTSRPDDRDAALLESQPRCVREPTVAYWAQY
jgi:CubicO group peptidase (beta-lactamase class C family)